MKILGGDLDPSGGSGHAQAERTPGNVASGSVCLKEFTVIGFTVIMGHERAGGRRARPHLLAAGNERKKTALGVAS